MVRVGIATFLETLPLSCGLDLPPWNQRLATTVFDDPRRAAAALDAESIDLALLPADLLAPRSQRLEIVPGLAVTSRGGCGIARLLYQPPLADIERVTSRCDGHGAATLLELLFAGSGKTLTFDRRAPQARLLTLGEDPEPLAEGWRSLDLSTAWCEVTGGPMVWWVWAARPGIVDREIYGILHGARSRGRHDLGTHLEQWMPGAGAGRRREVLRAFEDRVRLRLGNRELAALERLWREMESLALVPMAGPPRLLSFGGRPNCRPSRGE